MKVKCINCIPIDKADYTYPDLTLGNIYNILAVDIDSYRIIGNRGFPYLYDKRRFEVIDDKLDNEWEKTVTESGRILYNPKEFKEHLLSKYFDQNIRAINIFNRYVKKKFEKTIGKLEVIKHHPNRKNL